MAHVWASDRFMSKDVSTSREVADAPGTCHPLGDMFPGKLTVECHLMGDLFFGKRRRVRLEYPLDGPEEADGGNGGAAGNHEAGAEPGFPAPPTHAQQGERDDEQLAEIHAEIETEERHE